MDHCGGVSHRIPSDSCGDAVDKKLQPTEICTGSEIRSREPVGKGLGYDGLGGGELCEGSIRPGNHHEIPFRGPASS